VIRGWTEKEKVARGRQAESDGVVDQMSKSVSFREAIANVRYFMTYQIPESIFMRKDKN
jgi:hypothetical protein